MTLSADDLLFLARRGKQRETKPRLTLDHRINPRTSAKRKRFGLGARKGDSA